MIGRWAPYSAPSFAPSSSARASPPAAMPMGRVVLKLYLSAASKPGIIDGPRRPDHRPLGSLGRVGIMAAQRMSAMGQTRGQRFATRSVVMGRRGMVATSQPLATAVGVDVLRRGGSAVDAAIAANATLGLVEPTGCGIGGDLFAIVRDAGSRKLFGLNASGRSPRGLTRAHFERLGLEQVPDRGPLSVSVPGAVDGWFELHARFGALPFGELLAPAIGYARDGFPLTEVIARDWAAGARALRDYEGFAAVFLPGGRSPRAGEIFANPRLADAYELLATGGRDAFYRGPIAAAVHDYLDAQGGYL